MYKVFEVDDGKGWEIFWCPSAPRHYADRTPYDGRIYPHRPAAYRRAKVLNEKLKEEKSQQKQEEEHAA